MGRFIENTSMHMKHQILKIIGLALILFGGLTIFVGSSVLFDLFGIRAREGNYVPFVVVANVICGFLYLFSAYGLFQKKKWPVKALFVAASLLVLTFIALVIHIANGGIYETKTLFAMAFRTSLTFLLAFAAHYFLFKKKY